MQALGKPVDQIATREWEWIHEMIGEVEQQERREDFARCLFQWDLAIREFRKVELTRIILGEPSAGDLRFHAECLHHLLDTGRALASGSRVLAAGELQQLGVTQARIEAGVASLEQSLREWHHGFSAQEIAEAQQAIFGGAT